MSGRYPPLPFVIRLVIWPVRVLATLASLLAIFFVLFVSTWGEPGLAPESLIALLGFSVLVWMHPLSPWFLGVLAVIASSTLITGNPGGGLLGLGLVGLLWWMRRPSRLGILPRRAGTRFEIVAPDKSMVGARRHIRGFESLGFERVGAYRTRLGPFPVTVTLLIDPTGTSYASVTDAVLHVTSLFPGDRGLVTRNNELRVLPPYLLVNSEPGATPAELVQSHGRALKLVAERDHFPMPVSAPELADIAIAGEQRALEWTPSRSFDSSAWSGRLWERGGRYQQIDDWHAGTAESDQAS